jgi:hypothetical protein
MKTTLSTYQIADALWTDENAAWSRSGSLALAEYLEQYEEDSETELELDVVAIRCDYSEHDSVLQWAEDYFSADQLTKQFNFFDDEQDRAQRLEDSGEFADASQIREGIEEDVDQEIRNYIQDRGQLIEFDGGIIVSSF